MTDPMRHSLIEDVQGIAFGVCMAAVGMHVLTFSGFVAGQTTGVAALIAYGFNLPFPAVYFAVSLPFLWFGWRFLQTAEAPANPLAAETVAIRAGSVITDAASEPSGPATILIEDGKISASDGAELLRALDRDNNVKPNEPMKVMQSLKPISIKKLGDHFILDAGQNLAGWLQIKVHGKRGQQIKMRFAESLQPNGKLYVANLRDAKVTDVYTLSGEGIETWHPQFVYHGFRRKQCKANYL